MQVLQDPINQERKQQRGACELDIIRMNGTTVAVGDIPLAQLLDMRIKYEK